MKGTMIAFSLAIIAHFAFLNFSLSPESNPVKLLKKSMPISITLNKTFSRPEKMLEVPIIKIPMPKLLQSPILDKKKRSVLKKKIRIDTPKKIQHVPETKPAPIKLEKPPDIKTLHPKSIHMDKPKKTIGIQTQKSAKLDMVQESIEVIQTVIPSENIQIQSMVKPIYPRLARRQNREGTVQIEVEILKNGQIAEIKLYESSGSRDMDESAMDAMKRWQFKPATRNGRPIRHAAVIPITFTLE